VAVVAVLGLLSSSCCSVVVDSDDRPMVFVLWRWLCAGCPVQVVLKWLSYRGCKVAAALW
jgi:hypothetical protein